MTEDFIDQSFKDLEDYYPGSRRRRKPIGTMNKPKQSQDPMAWDTKSYNKNVGGKDMEFFTIGALAKAINRPIITVRTWIKLGYLPQSPYRLPPKVDKNGTERLGRRLYSRGMIEAVLQIFQENGILHEERIEWLESHRRVSLEIADAWSKLRSQELQTTT